MRIREHRGERLSVIGLGCYGLAGAYGPPRPRVFGRTLARAIELGITYFDTAPAFGEAERILGRAVARRRGGLFIATKIAVAPDGRADLSRKAIRSSCEESLRRLGTDRIDLLQIHYDDPRREPEDVIDALEGLVKEGKTRLYGIAHLAAERASAYIRAGRIFSVQMELSAVARQSESSLLPICRRHKIAAVAFSVTGRGLLAGRQPGRRGFVEGDVRRFDPLFQRERLASGKRIADGLGGIGKDHGRSAAQVAIAWVLSHPGVHVALTGPSRIDHLEENAAAGDWELPAGAAKTIERMIKGEEAVLREAQGRAIRSILNAALPVDLDAAFTDILYVMETSIDQELAREEDLIPIFRDLYALRGLRDPSLVPRFERIRRRLCEIAGFAVSS